MGKKQGHQKLDWNDLSLAERSRNTGQGIFFLNKLFYKIYLYVNFSLAVNCPGLHYENVHKN